MADAETKPEASTTQQKVPDSKPTKDTQEVQANCLGCNKPIKKLKRYYRDGKFYCNKKCWRKAKKSKKEEKK